MQLPPTSQSESRLAPRLSQKFSLPQLKALPFPAVSPTSLSGMTAPKAELIKETISSPCNSQFSCTSFWRWGWDSFCDCELCPLGLVPYYINSWWHLQTTAASSARAQTCRWKNWFAQWTWCQEDQIFITVGIIGQAHRFSEGFLGGVFIKRLTFLLNNHFLLISYRIFGS